MFPIFLCPSVDQQQLHAALSFHSEPAGSMPAPGRRRRQRQWAISSHLISLSPASSIHSFDRSFVSSHPLLLCMIRIPYYVTPSITHALIYNRKALQFLYFSLSLYDSSITAHDEDIHHPSTCFRISPWFKSSSCFNLHSTLVFLSCQNMVLYRARPTTEPYARTFSFVDRFSHIHQSIIYPISSHSA